MKDHPPEHRPALPVGRRKKVPPFGGPRSPVHGVRRKPKPPQGDDKKEE